MPSRKYEFTKKEVLAGLLVFAGALILALFVCLIKGIRPPENVNTFHAYFTDIAGLNVGGDVRFGGFKAGRVVHIGPVADKQSMVNVTFVARPEFPVNADSRAYITQTTLTAEPHLEITTGSDRAERLADGAEVPPAAGKGGGLFGGLDAIAQSLTPVLEDVLALLGVQKLEQEEAESGGGKQLVTIVDIFSDLDSAVTESDGLVKDVRGVVSRNSVNIETVLTKMREIQDGAKELTATLNAVVAENRPNISGAVEGLRRVIDNVSAVSGKLEQLEKTLQSTLDNTEAFSGEAKAFLEQNRPALEDMLLDLREAVRQLKLFARIVAEQPESVIRGKAPYGRK